MTRPSYESFSDAANEYARTVVQLPRVELIRACLAASLEQMRADRARWERVATSRRTDDGKALNDEAYAAQLLGRVATLVRGGQTEVSLADWLEHEGWRLQGRPVTRGQVRRMMAHVRASTPPAFFSRREHEEPGG